MGIGQFGREPDPVINQSLHTASQYRMLHDALKDINVGFVRRDVQYIEKEPGSA